MLHKQNLKTKHAYPSKKAKRGHVGERERFILSVMRRAYIADMIGIVVDR